MSAADIALLQTGLLPVLKFLNVLCILSIIPYNTRGATQATRRSVSKYFQKVSYFYISFKNVYAFIYLEKPTIISCTSKGEGNYSLIAWGHFVMHINMYTSE